MLRTPTDLDAFVPFRQERQRRHPRPEATIADVVAHVEHLREVAGPQHIGTGGDYDGTDALPVGLEDVSSYPRLFAALVDRGWADADLAALASGNVLRVLQDAEDVSVGT